MSIIQWAIYCVKQTTVFNFPLSTYCVVHYVYFSSSNNSLILTFSNLTFKVFICVMCCDFENNNFKYIGCNLWDIQPGGSSWSRMFYMRISQGWFCLIQSYLFVSNTDFVYRVCVKYCILVLGLCQTVF
jgi:hypothetical protein